MARNGPILRRSGFVGVSRSRFYKQGVRGSTIKLSSYTNCKVLGFAGFNAYLHLGDGIRNIFGALQSTGGERKCEGNMCSPDAPTYTPNSQRPCPWRTIEMLSSIISKNGHQGPYLPDISVVGSIH